jgi:hypothetical protein
VSDYELDDWEIRVRSPAEAANFSSSMWLQTGSRAHPASWPIGTRGLSPGVKSGHGVTLTAHPHLAPRSWMSRSYTYSPSSASMVRTGTALLFLLLHLKKNGRHEKWTQQFSLKPSKKEPVYETQAQMEV